VDRIEELNKIRDDIKAILKTSGIAAGLPEGLEERLCHSVANEITYEYSSRLLSTSEKDEENKPHICIDEELWQAKAKEWGIE